MRADGKQSAKSKTKRKSAAKLETLNRRLLRDWWNRPTDWRDPDQYPTSDADDVVWFTEFARRSPNHRNHVLESIELVPELLISEYFDDDGQVSVKEIAALVANALGFELRLPGLAPGTRTKIEGVYYTVVPEAPELVSLTFNLNSARGRGVTGSLDEQLRAAKRHLVALQDTRRKKGLLRELPHSRRRPRLYSRYLMILDAKEKKARNAKIIDTLMPGDPNGLDTLNKQLAAAKKMRDGEFLSLPCVRKRS